MTGLREVRPLAESDGPRVRLWLEDWLARHIGGWAPAYGLAWGADDIAAHIARHELVKTQWGELVQASTDPNSLVRIIELAGEPAGIVYAEIREDRYMKCPVGAVSWIYVDPARRGQGIAAALSGAARAWHSAQGAIACEVFATISNAPAIRSYCKAGFMPLDYRLVASPEPAEG